MTSAEVKPAEAPETEAEMKLAAKKKKKTGLPRALLLAQMTEQAFMEHQLAACHFAFYNFCEHAPALVVCVFECLSPNPP